MSQGSFTHIALQQSEITVYGNSRLVMYSPAEDGYYYEINDHLGNVRAVVASQVITLPFPATMEPENGATEEFDYINLAESRHQDQLNNKTPGGDHAAWLNAAQSRVVGPGIVLQVNPGDKVNLKVHAQYDGSVSGNNQSVTGFLTTLAGALAHPGATETQVYDLLHQALGAGALFTNDDDMVPKAYIIGLIFDNNKQFTGDFMYSKITNAANNAWEELYAEKTMDQAGYVYIYTATESNTNVDIYFDDFDISLEQTHIVAGNDYYPFGLPITERSYEKQDYRYDYQGQFAEKDDETGYNAFQLRQYDARIGRWISPDPYGQYASAYVGMGNNPVSGVDPDGGFNWGATLVGAGSGFAVGSLIGLAIDNDNWWKYGIAGATIGGVAGAIKPDLTISESASGWTEFRAEVEQAIVGGKGSVKAMAPNGLTRYWYGPGQKASWKTLAYIALPSVRQTMSQWCVFGCSESLNNYFGGNRTQEDFSRNYNNGQLVDRGIQGDRDYGRYFGTNFLVGENGRSLPSGDRITGHLKRNNPISINVDRGTINGQRMVHNMIIKGIQQNTKTKKFRLLIMDPAGQVNKASYRTINRVHRYYFVIRGI